MNLSLILLIICFSNKNFTECSLKSSNIKTPLIPSRKQEICDSPSRDPSPSPSYNLPETLYEEPSHYYKEMLGLNPNATPFYPGSSNTNLTTNKIKDALSNYSGYGLSQERASKLKQRSKIKSATQNQIHRDMHATKSHIKSSFTEGTLNQNRHGKTSVWNKRFQDLPSSRESSHVGLCLISNERNTGGYLPSQSHPVTNNFTPSANYYFLPNISPFSSRSARQNQSPAKIPIFSKEMQVFAAKFRTPVKFKPLVNFPDFIVVSYSSLRPKSRELSNIIYAIAMYDHNGSLMNLFHLPLPANFDSNKYWNAVELNLANPSLVRPLKEIKEIFLKNIENKIIVSYKLGRLLLLLDVGKPNHQIRDLSHLERYIVENGSSLLGIVRYFLPSEFPSCPECMESHLWDKKAHYIRKIYLKLQQTWEDEVSFHKEIKRKYAYQPRRLLQYYDNIYPGLQMDKEKDLSYWKEINRIPYHFFGMDIKRTYYNEVKSTVAVIFNLLLHRVFKTIYRHDKMNGPAKAVDENTFTGTRRVMESMIVRKLLQISNDSAPIIVGFNIYEKLKRMDTKKMLAGTEIYDTKEIFEAETVCELALKYTHIDYRQQFTTSENFTENSESSLSFTECDEKLDASTMAKISIKLFKLYCLNKHPSVRPLRL